MEGKEEFPKKSSTGASLQEIKRMYAERDAAMSPEELNAHK
jgi:hypothetical protein